MLNQYRSLTPKTTGGAPTPAPRPTAPATASTTAPVLRSVSRSTTSASIYVDADPWIGKQVIVQSQLGHHRTHQQEPGFEADPVNTANGNYAYSYTDISIPTRGLPLAFCPLLQLAGAAERAARLGLDPRLAYVPHREHGRLGPGHLRRRAWREVELDGAGYEGAPGVHGVLVKNPRRHLPADQKDQTQYSLRRRGRLA